MSNVVANRYLQRLARRVLGTTATRAGKPYAALTLRDFRHFSACYWRPRYPTEAAIMYRFGWKNPDKVNYYTDFLGMHDTITHHDTLLPTHKTELEQRLANAEHKNALLEEELARIAARLETMCSKISGDVR